MRELVIDNFAGGGGASTGIEAALGRAVDIAINHSQQAIEIHAANHPDTVHLVEDIFDVDPREAAAGRPVGLAWFSPDCTHHSRAKGGKPRSKKIRALAWVVIRWAATVKPRVIMLENVPEFQTWGPLTKDGHPDPSKKGRTFASWVQQLRDCGYEVEWRELVAADYGAPTTRKRFFLIARCDGRPIVWPEPTHGPGRLPYRTAAECIDWSLPCPSISERKRPLAENTLRRVARGIFRYVIDHPDPFIVRYHGEKRNGEFRGQGLDKPLPTQTTENHQAVCAAFLAKHYGGVVGHQPDRPIGAVTSKDHHGVTAAFLSKFYGTNTGSDIRDPAPTITATGQHIAEVRAFLVKYYATACGQSVKDPMHTITTKHRMGLVTIEVIDYQIVDIGLRMLQPHELAAAQGFPRDYILLGTKTARVAMIGNSVPPALAEVLVQANYREAAAERATA